MVPIVKAERMQKHKRSKVIWGSGSVLLSALVHTNWIGKETHQAG